MIDCSQPSTRTVSRRGVPPASSPQVLRRMQRMPRKDTAPEMALRRAIRSRGIGYRVDCRPEPSLRRKADIVFKSARVAVFVDGCFWHSCPKHRSVPKQNAGWWQTKLSGVIARDQDTARRLRELGWHVIRIWEHDDPNEQANKIANMVRARRLATRRATGR